MNKENKSALARALNVSRASLYYTPTKEKEDWALKGRIENVLCDNPSYGYRRVADELTLNRKKVQRVMRKYGIKARRRRRAKKCRKTKRSEYPNLLILSAPQYPHHIWAADFTEVWFEGKWVYIATVLDLYTREIVGVAVSLRKGTQLTLQALHNALLYYPCPRIFHSDNGSEYNAKLFVTTLMDLSILISRSRPGCPWENGYQESFYDKFKIELGDPQRCSSLGELVAAVYRTIHYYNTARIHSALKMPPRLFARRHQSATINS